MLAPAALAGPALAAREPTTSCPATPYLNGLDVSSYAGTITWSEVACEDFVYARATDGTYIDTDFSENEAGARGAGIPFGAYDYFEPDENPVAQANEFLSVYTPKPGDLPPALDVEVTDSQTASTILSGIGSWVSTVEAATGVVPVIYTYPDFWSGTLGDSTGFTADPLWDSYIGAAPPVVPDSDWGGNGWAMWQYSLNGTVTGVPEPGGTDLDYFAGSSTVTITSHTRNSVVGQPITVEAQVAGGLRGTVVAAPSGTVKVTDGTRSCHAHLSGSDGVATGSCAITEDAAGTHPFTASYAGDSNWKSSTTSSPTPVTVGKATSTTHLRLSRSRVTHGHERAERLSVTVAPQFSGPKPAGTVTVKESGRTLCVIKLAAGKGSCTLSAKRLVAGTYHLVATFKGSRDFRASASRREALKVVKS
jgi:GH25 family lysozyme M1 (1,4-beta-N-acetylmuramidase)